MQPPAIVIIKCNDTLMQWDINSYFRRNKLSILSNDFMGWTESVLFQAEVFQSWK